MFRLSQRQFAFLHALAEGQYVGADLEEMKALDCRTLGSLAFRQYVNWSPRKGLHFTNNGFAAYEAYAESEMPTRQHLAPLSSTAIKMLNLTGLSQLGHDPRSHRNAKKKKRAAA